MLYGIVAGSWELDYLSPRRPGVHEQQDVSFLSVGQRLRVALFNERHGEMGRRLRRLRLLRGGDKRRNQQQGRQG